MRWFPETLLQGFRGQLSGGRGWLPISKELRFETVGLSVFKGCRRKTHAAVCLVYGDVFGGAAIFWMGGTENGKCL